MKSDLNAEKTKKEVLPEIVPTCPPVEFATLMTDKFAVKNNTDKLYGYWDIIL